MFCNHAPGQPVPCEGNLVASWVAGETYLRWGHRVVFISHMRYTPHYLTRFKLPYLILPYLKIVALIDCWRSQMPKNGIYLFHTSKIDRILAYWNFIMWLCVSSLFEWTLIIIEPNNSFLMTISFLKLVVNIGLMFNFHKNLEKSFKCGLFGIF